MGERSCPRSHHLVSKSHRSWRLPARRRIHQTHANPPACRGTKARCSLSGSFLAAKGRMEKGLGWHGAAPHRALELCSQAARAGPGAVAVCPGRDWLPCLPCPLPPFVPRLLWLCATPLCSLSLRAAAPCPGLQLWLGVNAGGFSSACTCPRSRSGPLCFPWKCLSVPFFPSVPTVLENGQVKKEQIVSIC